MVNNIKRYYSLDAVRGVAAIAVIFYHTSWPTHLTSTSFIQNCYTAVDLFFLLSGFVIAASYQSRVGTGQQVSVFIIRRIFRVYPLQWAVLAVLLSIELVKLALQLRAGHAFGATHDAFTGVNSIPLLIASVLLIQGTGLFPQPGWNPPSWSVSTEIIAYIIFAMSGYLGVLRKSWFIASAACCGIIAYAALAGVRDTLDVTTDFGIVRCLAAFPLGVALFQLLESRYLSPLHRLTMGAASLLEGLAVSCALLVLGLTRGGAVVFVIPCFVVVIALFSMERGVFSRALMSRPFQYLGAISYSVYLVHVPIRNQLVSFAKYIGTPTHRAAEERVILDISLITGDVVLIILLIIVISVASLTFIVIEEPARLFGRRITGGRKAKILIKTT